MRSRRARIASASAGAVVAVAIAAMAVAGCGSSGGTTSAPSVVAQTTSTTSTTTPTPTPTPTLTSSTPTSTTSSSTTTTTASTLAAPTATSSTTTATPQAATGFTLSSPAFGSGGAIPSIYTCDGSDASVPLSWSGVPAGTKELVLVMRDPDAPGGSYVHWAVAGIDPTTSGFGAGGVSGMVIPGRNSSGTLGYTGPCPPQGPPHHYVITLSALASPSGLRPGFSADQLQASAVGVATLVGTYGR